MSEHRLIWIDFTTSLHWTRPPVGIIRVEQECTRWMLAKLKDRVRLCIFDPVTAQFLELAVQEAWDVLERDWNAPAPTPGLPPAPGPAPMVAPKVVPTAPKKAPRLARRLERMLRKIALATLDLIPGTWRPAARNYLIAVRRTLAHGYAELKAARAASAGPAAPAPATSPVHALAAAAEPPRSPSRPPARFGNGDSYLTMGLDWDHGNKMDVLYREKKRTGMRVFNFAYDIIPVKFPTYYPSGKFDLFSAYFATIGWTADKIFCISNCTERDLGAFLDRVGAPRPPMAVVRLGDALPATGTCEPSPEVAAILQAPFLLSVSTIEIRKNHESLYRAYLRLIESGFEVPTLVLVGMIGWRVDDFMYSLRNDPRVEGKIVILDHVSDADLASLYRGCLFTLYPSLYEGWGLPVAESLAYGKFCLASSAASIPEIAGDILDYVDPWDVPRWAEKIRLYCAEPGALRDMERRIEARYRATSWETTADQMIAAIESLPDDVGSPVMSRAAASRVQVIE